MISFWLSLHLVGSAKKVVAFTKQGRGCAGAVISVCKPRNSEIRNQKQVEKRPSNLRTEGRTVIASYTVACMRLKKMKRKGMIKCESHLMTSFPLERS